MSFKDLDQDELLKVVQFFGADIDSAADAPTKKELLAVVLQENITWEDYQDVYLKADDKVQKKPEAKQAAPTKARTTTKKEEEVLIKYERKNPTWQVGAYTFTREHPFKSVPVKIAEALIKNSTGFRIALPSEVADYYN